MVFFISPLLLAILISCYKRHRFPLTSTNNLYVEPYEFLCGVICVCSFFFPVSSGCVVSSDIKCLSPCVPFAGGQRVEKNNLSETFKGDERGRTNLSDRY